jgi:hypothetical protein
MIARLRASLETINRFMGRAWLTILYFTVVLPFGALARLRARNHGRAGPAWSVRKDSAGNLMNAREQF